MTINQSLIPIGTTGQSLDSVTVNTPAGNGLHRETVVSADPEDANGMARVRALAPAPGEYGLVVRQAPGAVLTRPLKVTTAGETLVLTPAAGKAVRIWFYAVVARATNSAEVEVALRWGAAGTNFLITSLSQYGGAYAHSFKAGDAFIQGAVDQSVYIDLSGAQVVYVNMDYEEVTP